MGREVEYTEEFESWWNRLTEGEHEAPAIQRVDEALVAGAQGPRRCDDGPNSSPSSRQRSPSGAAARHPERNHPASHRRRLRLISDDAGDAGPSSLAAAPPLRWSRRQVTVPMMSRQRCISACMLTPNTGFKASHGAHDERLRKVLRDPLRLETAGQHVDHDVTALVAMLNRSARPTPRCPPRETDRRQPPPARPAAEAAPL